ncbi:MAG TPA: antibiotic biosynthesis monooxygenase family protein [Candidatus Limnocylindrales bacterium]|nr:antibiotic biosynthesis monooxygenase family protein [Candidatus Limnocylindrales bacterium]
MIERHITFNVLPDRTADFEHFIATEYTPPIKAWPGFVKVELLREADNETRYQMVLRWTDGDAAAGWRTSDVHTALQPALNALHSGMAIEAYEVIG